MIDPSGRGAISLTAPHKGFSGGVKDTFVLLFTRNPSLISTRKVNEYAKKQSNN